MINKENDRFLKYFSGATARRVKMATTNGTSDIPAITPVAEELSKLKTLKEFREKWSPNTAATTSLFTPPVGGLFGLGKVPTPRRRTTMTKKRAAIVTK